MLKETLAEVKEKLQRYSWEVMDEEQRDSLLRDRIVPRWGQTTRDGHVLKATLWAEILGTTKATIEGRYYRLRRSEVESDASPSLPTIAHKGDIRAARSTIRKHPDLAEELVKDPQVRESVEAALAGIKPSRIRSERGSRSGPSLNEGWHRWAAQAEKLMRDGAMLLERTEQEAVALDAHATLARLVYERIVERQLDAELRQILDEARA